jgi:hypothetical protein
LTSAFVVVCDKAPHANVSTKACRCHHALCIRRVDVRRLAVAHPKLSPTVAATLHIPALEDVVVEVLDSFGASNDNGLQSIQVSVRTAGRMQMRE